MYTSYAILSLNPLQFYQRQSQSRDICLPIFVFVSHSVEYVLNIFQKPSFGMRMGELR